MKLHMGVIPTDHLGKSDPCIWMPKEYYLRIYAANDSLKYSAEGVRTTLALQKSAGKSVAITGYIDSTNADLSNIWCDIRLNADREFYINIVPGSGVLQTQDVKVYKRCIAAHPLSEEGCV